MNPFLLHRTLRQHRAALAVGFTLAGAATVLALYSVSPGFPPRIQSRNHHVGVATQRVLVDTVRSQVSSQGGGSPADGTATSLFGLVARANLLSGLLMTSEFGRRITVGAGLRDRRLIVIPPDGMGPLPGRRLDPGKLNPQAIALDVSVDQSIPVITLKSRAPDAAAARRLAASAALRLREYVDEQGASHHVPEAARLTALPTGHPTSETVVVGPRKLRALAVFFVVIALWSVGLVASVPLRSYWRGIDGGRGRAYGGPSRVTPS